MNYFQTIQQEAQNCLEKLKIEIESNNISNTNPMKLKEKLANACNKLFSIDNTIHCFRER